VSETTTGVRALVEDFFATMGRGDWDRLRGELLADGASWTMMAPSLGDGPPMDSAEAIVGFFSAGGAVFEDDGPEVTINRILVDGDNAAVEAVGNGRLRNGSTYANVYHFAVDTRDGRVVAVREYMDSHHVATVMPAPPA
jgi:ketosteroid isomerase-like protein